MATGLRRWLSAGAMLVGLGMGIAPAQEAKKEESQSQPRPPQPRPQQQRQRQELKFIQGLRDRGYDDLAVEYIDRLRADPAAPAEMKVDLEYERGRGLLEEASRLGDLDRRQERLEEARAALDAFAKAHPKHPLAPEALVQMARILLERGQTAALQAGEAPDARQRSTKLAEARASYEEARKAYDAAIEPLRAAYEKYPKYIPESDPQHDERDRLHVALMDAELQRGLVDYEDAQTYAPGSDERNARLDTARERFVKLYDDYRRQIAGFFAHMWEAKCFEERGDLGPAMGIYKELMDQPAPELAPLKRKVAYFQIIIDGKRGEHALAVDRAAAWLQAYPEAVSTDEGHGVRFQLAKNILLQLDQLPEAERAVAIRRATDLLTDVVRYPSPFKPEAIELLKKHKPAGALTPAAVNNLSYDAAMAQAEAAISTHEWDRALILLRQAVRRADPTKDAEKANRARYLMAYCYYQAQRYYESAVLAEHLVRHYPKQPNTAEATKIGLAAWTGAYMASGARDAADLARLSALAEFIAATWPDTDQGDSARMTLGEIALGTGRFLDATRWYEAVREKSTHRLAAMVRAGDARFQHSLQLRREGKAAEADAEVKAAQKLLEDALAARRAARVAATDPGLLTNVNALAEVYRTTGRPKDALDLLEPSAKALGQGTLSEELAPLRIALLTIQLRAHIANGQADQAIADMAALEKVGGAGPALTQLYFELGRSLQRELAQLEAQTDPAARARLDQTRTAYAQFLQALANSQAGQTYESLAFAGEALLALGQAKEAVPVLDRLIKTYGDDAEFRAQPGGPERILRAQLRRAEALRKQNEFSQAQEQLDEIKKLAPRALEPLMEQGYLHEDWARAESSTERWNTAFRYWKNLAAQLERGRPRRIEYYEALYRVAVALQAMNQPAQAAQTLKGVMTLSPTVGNPAMKAKYEALLSQLAPRR